jgi:hypothetical protein
MQTQSPVFEVLRASDIEQGGTDTSNPPIPGALFDAHEKRWMLEVRDEVQLAGIVADSLPIPIEVSDGVLLVMDMPEPVIGRRP